MLQGASQLNAKLARFAMSFDNVAREVAQKSVGDVAEAVRADIGDQSMSGWTREKPIPVTGMLEKQELAIVPVPRARGPMRVLESGRQSGGGFQGPGVNRKTGLTSKRGRAGGAGSRNRRWSAASGGKGTWSDAERLVGSRLGARSAVALTKAMASIFRRG